MAKTALNILVVEDDAVSRRLLQRALAISGFVVHIAEDGQVALEKLDLEPCPDIILLDLSMPNIDGATFVKELRVHGSCSKTKIVVMSGWDDVSERAKALGADAYIRKPIDLGLLERTLIQLA